MGKNKGVLWGQAMEAAKPRCGGWDTFAQVRISAPKQPGNETHSPHPTPPIPPQWDNPTSDKPPCPGGTRKAAVVGTVVVQAPVWPLCPLGQNTRQLQLTSGGGRTRPWTEPDSPPQPTAQKETQRSSNPSCTCTLQLTNAPPPPTQANPRFPLIHVSVVNTRPKRKPRGSGSERGRGGTTSGESAEGTSPAGGTIISSPASGPFPRPLTLGVTL